MVHSLHINRGLALFSPPLYPRMHATCSSLLPSHFRLDILQHYPPQLYAPLHVPKFCPMPFLFLFCLCNIHIITRHSASIHGIFFLRQLEPPLLSRYGYLLLVGQDHCHCNQISLRSNPRMVNTVCIISDLEPRCLSG